ncbi:hypothetical protein SAMN05216294_2874 [Flagellimonas zhangzhouensis]|uniref:Uncharacterized protein n=1 Tax=Flagellimonas zhangzhouensis TaxID=1073328 RepID=A0A1H2XXS2_9FLAO|nr:hypothetical protein SAMN05216294_2874 [Allomuricauda zhangzhouensis]SDW97388.1 hypothetical protein SAMN04487892_2866 [Allomuricauda zhangzhouensis]
MANLSLGFNFLNKKDAQRAPCIFVTSSAVEMISSSRSEFILSEVEGLELTYFYKFGIFNT